MFNSLLKSLRSFRFAAIGIFKVFRYENNARIHLVAALAAISLGFLLKISRDEWLWILLAIGLVFICETINTAIEEIVNLVSPDWNKKAGNIKDLSAGAVLLAAIFAFATGLIIFIPKIF